MAAGHLPKRPGPMAEASVKDAMKRPGSNKGTLKEAGRNSSKPLREAMGHVKSMHISHNTRGSIVD